MFKNLLKQGSVKNFVDFCKMSLFLVLVRYTLLNSKLKIVNLIKRLEHKFKHANKQNKCSK